MRIFELKEKFRCLIKQDSEKKNVLRDLSSCIIEKFNGFNIVRIEFDIIYKPQIIECFFSLKINLVYRSTFSENKKIRPGAAFQCYFCSNYYGRKDKYDRHMEIL